MLWFPLDGLIKIWRKVFLDNPEERVRLLTYEDCISARPRRVEKGVIFVQLKQVETNYIKNLYEAVI